MFKWKNPRTGLVHANELLESDALCGKYLFDEEHPYEPVEHDTAVTCLNCEREVRYLARSGEQYREWMGKPNAWHPRFGPKPGTKGRLTRYCMECANEQPYNSGTHPECCGQKMLLVDGCTVVDEVTV